MRYQVSINIMPKAEIADPQGQTVESALPRIGFDSMTSVRVGKRIQLSVEASDEQAAFDVVSKACEKFLANPIIEDFEIQVQANG